MLLRTLVLLLLLPLHAHALTLQEGLDIVASVSHDIKIAESERTAAQGALALARAPYFPALDLYGRETLLRHQPEAKFGPAGPIPTGQDRFTTYGARATQLIYDFGKTSSAVSAARYGVSARDIDLFRARNRAALEFIYAYLDLLEADQMLEVARNESLRYEMHSKDAEARYSAGVVTKNEVLQAKVLLADSRQRLLTAEHARRISVSRLNSLLRRPLTEDADPSEIIGAPALAVPLEEAWSTAEAENPDLRELDMVIQAKEAGLGAIRAEHLPVLSLTGGYEYQENKYLVHDENWSLIAGVSMNLSAGGATQAKLKTAKAELEALRVGRQKLLDAIRIEVQAAHLALESSRKKQEVAMAAVTQAAENLRLQRLRYQEGVGTATEVTDAVTLMTGAETNAWQASFGVRRAEAGLYAALGKDLVAAYAQQR